MIYSRSLGRFALSLTPPLSPCRVDGQRLDPRLQWLLRLAAWARTPPLTGPTLAAARRAYRRSGTFLAPRVAECAARDLGFSGAAGPLRARLYEPSGLPRPSPGLLYAHGGGWTLGNLDTHDGVCRALAVDAGCRVVAVDYRLAPEQPYPAAVEDVEAAFREAQARAVELGIDPERLAVGGDSAGANLATVVARRARDAGGPLPAAQLLIYPGLDMSREAASYDLFGEGFLITRADIRWFKAQYLPDVARRTEPDASPLLAADLSGLPPAVVVIAGFDPLRDEGRAYVRRLRAAKVPVEEHVHPGLVHGFLHLQAGIPAARSAARLAARALRRRLRPGNPRPDVAEGTRRR